MSAGGSTPRSPSQSPDVVGRGLNLGQGGQGGADRQDNNGGASSSASSTSSAAPSPGGSAGGSASASSAQSQASAAAAAAYYGQPGLYPSYQQPSSTGSEFRRPLTVIF